MYWLFEKYGKNQQEYLVDGVLVCLSTNYPFINQGFITSTDHVYIKTTMNVEKTHIFIPYTIDTIQHELQHVKKLKEKIKKYGKVFGWINFFGTLVFSYIKFWVPYVKKPYESDAEEAEAQNNFEFENRLVSYCNKYQLKFYF